MPSTYSMIYAHLVFSTKKRRAVLIPGLHERVWSYVAGVAKENKITPIEIGGVEDHCHALVGLPTTLSHARVAQILKGGSLSAFIKTCRNYKVSPGRMAMARFR